EKNNVFDIIKKVTNGKLSDTLIVEDHRGGKHTVFIKDGDIFYCTSKSDTVNLSYSEMKSSNPFMVLAGDTLSIFWREETEKAIDVFYRRRFILAPVGQWTKPTCVYTQEGNKGTVPGLAMIEINKER
ncbi:MAG: hypothetical protein ABIL05_03505, partial [candidate division WOR-3 bacterium]